MKRFQYGFLIPDGGTAGARRRTRRLFAALLCLALLLPAAALGEAAREDVRTHGLYQYVLRPGGDAQIVRYSGEEERLTIPDTLDGHPVTAVGDRAFSEDWKLKAVTIPARVTDLGANPFAECLSLTRITVAPGHPTLAVADGGLYDKRTETLIAWPADTEEKHVTVAPGTRIIGDSAFAVCRWILSVDLPQGVVSIGDGAFSECISLTNVALPDSLTEIGDDAFLQCHALTDIALPGSLTRIGADAFNMCDSLRNVTLPEGLTALGRDAFWSCRSLESVTLPDSLTDLEYNPFVGCRSLVRIGLSASHPALRLQDGVLYNRQGTRLVCYPASREDAAFTVPAGVRQIGADAFSGFHLTDVTLPEGVEEIGERAFSSCSALAAVALPQSLRIIGDGAFAFCGHLGGVTLPRGLERIGRDAFNSSGITALALPEGVTEVGEEAFAACASLAEVTFPSTLDRISDRAFYNCGALRSVILPEGLTRIGDEAFAYCGGLSAAVLPESLAGVGQDAFWQCGQNLMFTVPRGGYAEEFCRMRGYAYAYADAPSVPVGEGADPWILAHPDLGDIRIGRDRMNLYVYWVQVRLKATGRWYQGEEWDCTGNLGSHTMSEISAFMRAAAAIDHDGSVDQFVIDALADVPGAPEVRVGGFYDRLNTLTGGDRYGDMTRVDRNSPRDAVKWVQICLKHLGYYTSSIDGDFGPGTLRALHAFQKQYGWVERDSVSYGVARDLLERYAAAGGDMDALP